MKLIQWIKIEKMCGKNYSHEIYVTTPLKAVLIIIKLLICRSDYYYVTQLIHNCLHEGCLTICKNIKRKKKSHSLLAIFPFNLTNENT